MKVLQRWNCSKWRYPLICGKSSYTAMANARASFRSSTRVHTYKTYSTSSRQSTINSEEVAKFSRTSDQWWNETGEYGLLHRMNPTRVQYIRQQIEMRILQNQFQNESAKSSVYPFQSLNMLDVGCGGGLLCESLARLGGNVLGVDASASNIAIAKLHAAKDPQLRELRYENRTAESLLEQEEGADVLMPEIGNGNHSSWQPNQFDVVTSLEVIEHVNHPQEFVSSLCSLVKPGGLLFLATMNRTALSYLLTIFAAEYVLRWVRPNTHDWNKYVPVETLKSYIEASNHHSANSTSIHPVDVCGMMYNPLLKSWSLTPNSTNVNYILCAQRTAST